MGAIKFALGATAAEEAPTEKQLIAICDKIVKGFVVTVTPELAAQWLQTNRDNRPVKPGNQSDLERTLRQGLWRLTHQGICFRSDGVLLDGQHRLRAIVASGISAPLLVFVGWDKEANDGVDLIAKRSLRDILRQDPRLLEPAAFLVRAAFSAQVNARAIPGEVQKMLNLMGDSLVALVGGTGGRVKTRTAAPVVAGAVMRHHEADAAGKKYIEDQWRAFVRLDIDAVSRSVGRLFRRLESITASGAQRQAEQWVCSWRAFDPHNRNMSRIIVEAGDLQAARQSLLGMIEKAGGDNA
jgi:hypothetical protein